MRYFWCIALSGLVQGLSPADEEVVRQFIHPWANTVTVTREIFDIIFRDKYFATQQLIVSEDISPETCVAVVEQMRLSVPVSPPAAVRLFDEGIAFMERHRQLCESGLLDSVVNSLDWTTELFIEWRPATLMDCLTRHREFLTSADLQILNSSIRVMEYESRNKHDPRQFQACRQIVIVWLAYVVPWHRFRPEHLESCMHLASGGMNETIQRLNEFWLDINRLARHRGSASQLYEQWLSLFWRRAVVDHVLIPNDMIPDECDEDNFRDYFSDFLANPAALDDRPADISVGRPRDACGVSNACSGGGKLQKPEPGSQILVRQVWEFIFQHKRAGLFALFIALQRYAHESVQKLRNEGLEDQYHFSCGKFDSVWPIVRKSPWKFLFGAWHVPKVIVSAEGILNSEIFVHHVEKRTFTFSAKPAVPEKISFPQFVAVIDVLVEDRINVSLKKAENSVVPRADVGIIPGKWIISNRVEFSSKSSDDVCDKTRWKDGVQFWRFSNEEILASARLHLGSQFVSSVRNEWKPWEMKVGARTIRLERRNFAQLVRKFSSESTQVCDVKFRLPLESDSRACLASREPPGLTKASTLSTEVTRALTCLARKIWLSTIASVYHLHYRTLINIRRQAEDLVAVGDSNKVSRCEQALALIHVGLLNTSVGTQDAMMWCLGLFPHVTTLVKSHKYLKESDFLIEAILVIGNKIVRANRFGDTKYDVYLHTLASVWMSALHSLFNLETLSVDLVVNELRNLTRKSLSDYTEEFWVFLFREGRSGLMALLVAKLQVPESKQIHAEIHLHEDDEDELEFVDAKEGPDGDEDFVLARSHDALIEKATEILSWTHRPHVLSFPGLVEAIDLMVDDIVLNSL